MAMEAAIDARPTKPETTTTASQQANSGSSRNSVDAGERADQRGDALAAAEAVPHREDVADDGGERAGGGAARPPARAARAATPGSASHGSSARPRASPWRRR